MKGVKGVKGVLFRAQDWLGVGQHTASTSRLLVSFYVQQQHQEESKSMPPRSLSRTSRRILLTTSIWSVIIIVVVFFVTYTVLLVYVDHPFRPASKLDHGRHRVRLLGKGYGVTNETKEKTVHYYDSNNHHKVIWDPRLFDDPTSEMPQCLDKNVFTIIIATTPDHFEHREAIRRTWCNSTLQKKTSGRNAMWQCVFLVGQTNDAGVRLKMSLESQITRDILQGSYIDSYRNLTLKVMHGLAWVSDHCKTPYVLKTDDDCFVNTILLHQFLLHHNKQTTDLYAGNIVVDISKRKVIRRKGEKWAVSIDDFLPKYYPKFASGSGYIFSIDVLTKLVAESMFVKPIPNEDAYVGIVMNRLGVEPTLSGRFMLASSGLRPCNFLYFFVAHGVTSAMQQEMCTMMLIARTQCNYQEEVLSWY